jgi:SAM-dependent methyltransferase
MMKTKSRFIEHYKAGYMPWVHKKPDFNLVEMVENWPIKPCRTLEVGCGTGTDSIWLAKKDFEVTAVDVSEIPIGIATEHALKSKVNVNFLTRDFLTEAIPGSPFDFVFDRGYFHSYRSSISRKAVARAMAKNLNKGGLWLTLVGSCDSPPREGGPPMRSAKNIIDAVESFFEVLLLKTSKFGSDSKEPANIWVCLLKKRI